MGLKVDVGEVVVGGTDGTCVNRVGTRDDGCTLKVGERDGDEVH